MASPPFINDNLEATAQAYFDSLFFPAVESDCTLADIAEVNPVRQLKKGEKARCFDMATLPTNGCIPTGDEIKPYNGGVRFINGDTLIARITPCLENGKAAYINLLEDGEVAFGSTEYDVCACCAPHVKRTGEVGLIKFIHMQNYKGGVRITMVCGSRALGDYRLKEESVKAIMFRLSAKEELIAEAVERLKEENASLKVKVQMAQQEILRFKAEKIEPCQKCVCLFEEELSGNGPRELMNLVLDKRVTICGIFAGSDEEGYRYVIGSRTEDVRKIAKDLNAVFTGRGGGKPEMVQGSLVGVKNEIQGKFFEIIEQQ